MTTNRLVARPVALLAGVLVSTFAFGVDVFVPLPQEKRIGAAPANLVGTLAVGLNDAGLTAMKVGETATVALPNGRSYQLVLDRIDHHVEGDYSWVGHVAGESPDRFVILTMGTNGTYGSLSLPDGTWGIVPGDGNDWLFDADASRLDVHPLGLDDAKVPPDLLGRASLKADPVCPVITGTPTPQTTIDVLFVMTPDFVSAHGGAANASTRINNLITSINTYYVNSKIAITLRRVAAINVTYPSAAAQDALDCSSNDASCDSAALNNVTNGSGVFSHVALIRQLYGADMVAFMRGPHTGGNSISGLAWVGGYSQSPISGSAQYMYALCGDAPGFSGTLVAHELGHNMGNNHDPANAGSSTPGATSYAYGYTLCGSNPGATCPSTGGFNSTGTGGFGTIMSYWRPTNPRFSNPNDTCSFNGSATVPCGATIASASPAFSAQTDEVRTINCTRTGIAAMRTAFVPDCTAPTQDSDGDGVPDCIERALGMNTAVKDNDIFSSTANSTLLFAMQQYRDLLAREADADGANFWGSALFAGSNNRTQMIDNFVNSAEFQGVVAPVARMYFAYFLRIPDYAGLTGWINNFKSGFTLNQISQAFATSPEFISRYGSLTNSQFVTLVYNNLFNRAPDSTGLSFWTGQLNTGATDRGGMMAQFSESAEYKGIIGNKVYVTMIYSGMLKRAPDQAGFDYWVGYLNGGNTGLTLINGFIGSSEYRNRFLP